MFVGDGRLHHIGGPAFPRTLEVHHRPPFRSSARPSPGHPTNHGEAVRGVQRTQRVRRLTTSRANVLTIVRQDTGGRRRPAPHYRGGTSMAGACAPARRRWHDSTVRKPSGAGGQERLQRVIRTGFERRRVRAFGRARGRASPMALNPVPRACLFGRFRVGVDLLEAVTRRVTCHVARPTRSGLLPRK